MLRPVPQPTGISAIAHCTEVAVQRLNAGMSGYLCCPARPRVKLANNLRCQGAQSAELPRNAEVGYRRDGLMERNAALRLVHNGRSDGCAKRWSPLGP